VTISSGREPPAGFSVDAQGRLVRAAAVRGRGALPDRALFAEDLASLLNAGLTVHESLGVMAQGMTVRREAARLSWLQSRIAQGTSLSAALAAEGEAFGPVLVALVQASEQSASLAPALERFASDTRRAESARGQIVSALVYPLLLLAVGLAVTAFLLGWVVPSFAGAIDGRANGLSGTAQTLLAVGEVLGRTRGWWLSGLVVVALGLAALLASPSGRRALAERAASLSALRPTLRLLHASRFFATAGTLTQSGLPAPTAFELAAPLLLSEGRAHVEKALTALRAGRPLASSLEGAVFGDPVVGRLLEVGQRTGALPATLLRITTLLEARATRRVQRLVRVFEPALMVLLGVLIGGIVLLMYVPLLEISSALQ
jgi:general secretion pathway protein F